MRAALLVFLALFLVTFSASGGTYPKGKAASSDWAEVDRLAGEQKLQAALDATLKLLESARSRSDERLATEAIIKAAQFEMGLHGYETAVRFVKETPWPKHPGSRALLQLYYAHSLVQYQNMYGWEIGQREKSGSSSTPDLKAMTTEQIGREASRAFDAAMEETAGLEEPVPGYFRVVLVPGNYPVGVRPVLRDAVVYLAVAHLANQQFWSPKEANDAYKQGFAKLAALEGGKRFPAASSEQHPLARIASWLAEHHGVHLAKGRREAALEARYALLETLHTAASEDADKAAIRERLRATQGAAPRLPWWSRGQALLAELIRAEDRPGKLIDARKEALAGREAFPASEGGTMCAAIVFEIERPEYGMAMMGTDAAGKRSLLVTYRNFRKLYFRAYKVDWEEQLKSAKGNNAFGTLERDTLLRLLSSASEPVAKWHTELQETPDFVQHRHFVDGPGLKSGAYMIVASMKEDFKEGSNFVQAVRFIVSDLVLSLRRTNGETAEVRALSGASGRPIQGAEISLYRFNWRAPVEVVKKELTNAEGYATFSGPGEGRREGWSYFLVGRLKGEVAADNMSLWFNRESEDRTVSSAFVYTDRAIYRPLQKIQFKVQAYSGSHREGKFTVAPAGTKVSVRLLDPNHQMVGEKQITVGAFGSGAGEFTVPAGRPLGGWQLQVSPFNGGTMVKVEEYKRPTFESSLKEAGEPLRLNRKAKLAGEARYYFGLPVTAGTARWRVTRAEVTPWWWEYRGWWNPGRARAPETVASGEAPLKPDGSFELEFTPEADERNAGEGVSFNFSVEVDVTDEGGETRSASRAYRLGFVAVEAKLSADVGYFRTGMAAQVKALLTSLDGKPLKGTGSYRVARLEGKAMLPADLPYDGQEQSWHWPRGGRASKGGGAGKSGKKTAGDFATDNDLRRARWETDFRWETVVQNWKEGAAVGEGKVEHDEKGEGVITLKGLDRSGAYRVTYSTKDSFGAPFEVSRDFLVGSAQPEIPLPLLVLADSGTHKVGETAKLLVHSGLENQPYTVEVFRAGKRLSRRHLLSGKEALLDIPVTADDRGGFTVLVTALRDHQVLRAETSVLVPWSDKELKVEFSTFRDKLRPGQHETFKITVKNDKGAALEKGGAELLAYMYDRSLDLFATLNLPSPLSIYPGRTGAPGDALSLGMAPNIGVHHTLQSGPPGFHLQPDHMEIQAGYGIGGPGRRGFGGFGGAPGGMLMEAASMDSMADASGSSMMQKSSAAPAAPRAASDLARGPRENLSNAKAEQEGAPQKVAAPAAAASPPRSNFSETAFFAPHLITGPGGTASIEFTAPESVTSWRVLAHAVTKDLRGGTVSRDTRTVKELMVRPYIPRFLREGDEAEIKVQVNNASDGPLSGELVFEIENLATGQSALSEFGFEGSNKRAFTAPKGGSASLGFPVRAPKKLGDYAFKVTAKAKNYSDGERRPIPLLPSRMHLAQSRFVTLHHKDAKTLEFKDLAASDDPSLINEKLVVTVDAQLFYGVLQALPYLVQYPYECVEQTLNRFLSTGIVSSIFGKYPAVAKMAKDFSARKTELEKFDEPDPNRRMALEETPWLEAAQGGKERSEPLINVLNPEIARAERDAAMAKLQKMQLPDGGFPWFQGGPPDEHMTIYLLLGLSRAVEFKVDVPRDLVQRAWRFVRGWLDSHLSEMISKDYGWESVTLIRFALSSYPDDSWTGNIFDDAFRKKLLDFSFKHWKKHSPLLKGYLALTLKRSNRASDAKLVWDSVMDSAKHSEELGTYWAREDRSWLWYNDEIETHAFALRTQMELNQKDKHNEGMVQWLFLNKKLNHWKSTRATAEVIYSLVHYLDSTAQLGVREAVKVEVGNQQTEFQFDPDKYTGKKNQLVIPGDKVDAKTMAKINVSKSTPGFAFASATWHFSTDKLPAEERGDFFAVTRRYFRREHVGGEWRLVPLAEGAKIRVGDQLEVQLSLRAKHAAEYVHLRDPRGAGFEPETLNSGYKWDLGIFWYEETRDSGSNFFFSQLPVGEYTFKYRLRANMAGSFRVGPATVQSMYAPEFNAYSAGDQLRVEAAKE